MDPPPATRCGAWRAAGERQNCIVSHCDPLAAPADVVDVHESKFATESNRNGHTAGELHERGPTVHCLSFPGLEVCGLEKRPTVT